MGAPIVGASHTRDIARLDVANQVGSCGILHPFKEILKGERLCCLCKLRVLSHCGARWLTMACMQGVHKG